MDFICEINSTQVDHAKDHHIVMTMYNVIDYNGNYSKTFGSLQQYSRDESNNDDREYFESFKFKSKMIGTLLLMAILKMLKSCIIKILK